MSGKNKNIEDKRDSDNSSSVIIKKSNRVRNLASRSGFLTSGAKIAFAQLKKTFIKDPILHYFKPNQYIQSKNNAFENIIEGILSQLTLKIKQQNLVAFFFKKKILIKI